MKKEPSDIRQKISFSVVEAGKEVSVTTYHHEYRDLRALLNDKFCLDAFGECGGIGRCATCIITVADPLSRHDNRERKEMTSLQKAGAAAHVRLACQIQIDDRLSNIQVVL